MSKTTLVSELARTVLRRLLALALSEVGPHGVLVPPDLLFRSVGSAPRTTGAAAAWRVLPG